VCVVPHASPSSRLLEGGHSQYTQVSNLANAASLIYNSLLAFPLFGSGDNAVNWCGKHPHLQTPVTVVNSFAKASTFILHTFPILATTLLRMIPLFIQKHCCWAHSAVNLHVNSSVFLPPLHAASALTHSSDNSPYLSPMYRHSEATSPVMARPKASLSFR
jgi:hypothetical protein